MGKVAEAVDAEVNKLAVTPAIEKAVTELVDEEGDVIEPEPECLDEEKKVETAGVLAKGADRLSSEQLARYFIRAFKDKQLGKDRSDGPGIKSTLGTELQALTESQVFRFPSTFTFIFRAIA